MTTERDRLREEIVALGADEVHALLLFLVGSDPDVVRHALDTERATRPPVAAERAEAWDGER